MINIQMLRPVKLCNVIISQALYTMCLCVHAFVYTYNSLSLATIRGPSVYAILDRVRQRTMQWLDSNNAGFGPTYENWFPILTT